MVVDSIVLRNGGEISVDNSAIYIDRPQDDEIIIRKKNVRKVSLEVFKWSLALMSLVTVAFGTYFALAVNLLGGVLFSGIGVWSLYRTYTKRYALFVWVDGQAGPITVYPERPKECHAAIASLIRESSD